MLNSKLLAKAMEFKVQPYLAVALAIPFSVHANNTELDIGYGFGWDDNIFLSETQEEDEVFGILDLGLDYNRDISDRLSLKVDVTYEDKHFKGESNARDRFFSAITELKYQGEGFAIGGQIDPQYTQFVTSDTDGGLIQEGKQRISTLRGRLFTEIDIGDNNSVEIGYEKKDKDYRDSDSDYDADIVDIRFRSKISESLSLSFGGEKEERDYDRRLAVTDAGASVVNKSLEIERATYFVKGTWRPSANQKYSLEYRQRDNDDGFEGYYGHDKDQISFRTKYGWDNGVALKTKIKLSDKSYDEQLADNGKRLESDKVGVDIEVEFPMSLMFGDNGKHWRSKIAFKWDDYESGQAGAEFEKNSIWFTVHRTFD